MHVGFGVCFRLGQFSLVAMFALVTFIPSWVWDEVVFRRLRTRERLGFKLYYQPGCSFCSTFTAICSNFFLIPETEVIALDEVHSKGDYKESDSEVVVDVKPSRTFSGNTSSWLIVRDFRGITHSNAAALVQICKVSPLLWPLSYVLNRKFVFYKVARVLGWHSHLGHIFPKPLHISRVRSERVQLVKDFFKYLRIVSENVIGVFVIVFILMWNFSNVGYPQFGPPQDLKPLAWVFHWDQTWSMFSPRPPNVFWSYIIQGELHNGTEVELWKNEGLFNWVPHEMSWDKPDPFWRSFKNHRWFKYYENGINSHPNNDQLRLHFG